MTKALKLVADQGVFKSPLLMPKREPEGLKVIDLPPLGGEVQRPIITPAPESEEPKDGWALRIFFGIAGLAGVGISCYAIWLEVARNWYYGLEKGGDPYGYTYAAFGVGLALIPFLARAIGWRIQLYFVIGWCFMVSFWCGMSYYADRLVQANAKQEQRTRTFSGATQTAEEAANERKRILDERRQVLADVAAAEEERKLAQARADAYKVAGKLADLEKSRKEAADAAETCPNWSKCKTARSVLEKANADVANARLRDGDQEKANAADARKQKLQTQAQDLLGRADALQARKDNADQNAKAGPGTNSGIAQIISQETGMTTASVNERIELLEPLTLTIGILLLAGMLDPSLGAIVRAFTGHSPSNHRKSAQPGWRISWRVRSAVKRAEKAQEAAARAEAERELLQQAAAAENQAKKAQQAREAQLAVLQPDEKKAMVIGELFVAGTTWRATSTLIPLANERLREMGGGEFTHITFPRFMEAAGLKKEKKGNAGWFVDVK